MSAAIRFLADEDFDNDIVRGVLRRNATVDIVTVQEVGLESTKDPGVLAWAAQNGRIVLTRDVNTMVAEAYTRLQNGLPLLGLFAVPQLLPIAQAIDDILLIAECSLPDEWNGQVRFLPLR